jgi:peptide deformylase
MIFGLDSNPRYPDVEMVPTTVLVNPEFSVISDEVAGFWEGCLSVPGMRGYVERRARIKYRGFDQFGMLLEREAEGFHAVVFQHEHDHLDGILYPDHITEREKFGYTAELVAAGII